MRRNLSQLIDRRFDLLVIGAGIQGACIAWDASLRGLSVAILDCGDFGAATSANSLRIVHGGLRYLGRGDLSRMRESIRERTALLRIAPHLVHPLPVLVPISAGSIRQGRAAYRIALATNDLLSWDRNHGLAANQRIPRGRLVSRAECLRLVPWLSKVGLSGGALWHDGSLRYPERLTLAFVCSAYRRGAVPANYVRANRLLVRQGVVEGAAVTDVLDGAEFDVRADAVVVAAGPWTGGLITCTLKGTERPDQVQRPTGALALNLVIRRQLSPVAVGVPGKTSAADDPVGGGNRFLFIHPQPDATLLGTWYSLDGGQNVASACELGARRLVQDFNAACPDLGLSLDEIVRYQWGWLPQKAGHEPGRPLGLAERPIIVNHGLNDGVRHLFSVEPVKFTTARAVAETVVDRVFRDLDRPAPPCSTAELPLDGAGAALALNGPWTPPDTLGVIRDEMAVKLGDIVFRRFPAGPAPTLDRTTVEDIARVAAVELGWSVRQQEAEVKDVLRQTTPSATLLEPVA
jgi:glycerol-3-phosphate dehydrogenase